MRLLGIGWLLWRRRALSPPLPLKKASVRRVPAFGVASGVSLSSWSAGPRLFREGPSRLWHERLLCGPVRGASRVVATPDRDLYLEEFKKDVGGCLPLGPRGGLPRQFRGAAYCFEDGHGPSEDDEVERLLLEGGGGLPCPRSGDGGAVVALEPDASDALMAERQPPSAPTVIGSSWKGASGSVSGRGLSLYALRTSSATAVC